MSYRSEMQNTVLQAIKLIMAGSSVQEAVQRVSRQHFTDDQIEDELLNIAEKIAEQAFT